MKRLAAAALLALSLEAQHRDEITVEVVEVPVYVGVAGLGQDRFELFVNGKAQPIEYFDVVDFTAPAESRRHVADIRRRRLFLLVFDLVFSRPAALARGRTAAAKFVLGAPAGDAFAVATHTHNKGLQFVVPFTSDRAVVANAIARLRANTADDPLRLRITDSEREAVTAFAAESSASGGDPVLEAVTSGADLLEDLQREPMRRLIEHQAEELGMVSRRVSQLDGHKHIVVFSEGFSPVLVHDVQKSRGPGPPRFSPTLIATIEAMNKNLQGSETFLHAVDIAGLRHTFDPGVNEALNMLSVGTGGQFVRNANDIAGALSKLEAAHRSAYVLGFKPRNARPGHNTIEVRVRDLPRRTSVTYRKGFSAEPVRRGIDGLRLADIVTNDIPQYGVAVALQRSEDGVILKVPPGAKTEALVYVFDSNGISVHSRALRLQPEFDSHAIPLALPAGNYVVKVLVIAGQSLGFARLAITVPTAERSDSAAATPARPSYPR